MKKLLLNLCTILSLCAFAAAQTTPVSPNRNSQTVEDNSYKPLIRATKEQIRQAQKFLKVSETGEINQEYNTALKNYQTKNGLIASGYLGRLTLEKMAIALTDEQKKIIGNAPKNKKCPNFNPVQNICISVIEGQADTNPISMRYRLAYQTQILEASCADPEIETDEIISKKISGMFAAFDSQLTCTFEISNGSLLKFGLVLSKNSDAFIYDLIKWKVNFNNPDPADDGRTVLDYLQKKIIEHKDNELGKVLQGYYDRLKAAGAKHKSEL